MINNELPNRKYPRLKEYDYSSNGYYHVTICTKKMECIFGHIEKVSESVGWGLAPTERIYKDAKLTLFSYGIIAEQQLFELEKRYHNVKIDKYVIMPNHIHAIIVLENRAVGASPHPTLSDIICAYKSVTTRLCNKTSNIAGRQIFQRSFYDEILRNENGYLEVWQYIDENPLKWQNDEYFA